MKVSVSDLDRGAKCHIRDIILDKLFKTYHSLPLPGETDKIKDILTSDVIEQLEQAVRDYYKVFSERSGLDVNISQDDYLRIYLQSI